MREDFKRDPSLEDCLSHHCYFLFNVFRVEILITMELKHSCNILNLLFQPLEVRLRSGALVSEGRVEIKYNDFWGTICDDHWTLREANVVCRSLGYGSAAIAARNAYYGRGSGRVIKVNNTKNKNNNSDINEIRLIKCEYYI